MRIQAPNIIKDINHIIKIGQIRKKTNKLVKSNKSSREIVISQINFAEQLSDNFTLPLPVRGVFLTEGRHLKKYYSEKHLKQAPENPKNQRFPIIFDHEKNKYGRPKTGKMIGVVSRIEFDDNINGLRWWGHINDELSARNILDRIITDVSATIYSDDEYDYELGLLGTSLLFQELSLVAKGKDSNNYIEVDL